MGNLELSNKVNSQDFGRKIYLPISPISFYGIEPYQEIDNHHVNINYRSPCRHTVTCISLKYKYQYSTSTKLDVTYTRKNRLKVLN